MTAAVVILGGTLLATALALASVRHLIEPGHNPGDDLADADRAVAFTEFGPLHAAQPATQRQDDNV